MRGTPPGSKFFQLHTVFGKISLNRVLASPPGLAPPLRGDPGSATELSNICILAPMQSYKYIEALNLHETKNPS